MQQQAFTVTDHVRGTEIHLGESAAAPGKTNVVIFAKTQFDCQQVIQDLADEYNNVTFTNPARTADNKWGAMGRVWNEVLQ